MIGRRVGVNSDVQIISTMRNFDAAIVAVPSSECLTLWLKRILPLLSYGGIVCAYTSGAEQATAAHNYLWAMQKEEGTTMAPQEIYFGSQRPRVWQVRDCNESDLRCLNCCRLNRSRHTHSCSKTLHSVTFYRRKYVNQLYRNGNQLHREGAVLGGHE